jgi:hypothetical protein
MYAKQEIRYVNEDSNLKALHAILSNRKIFDFLRKRGREMLEMLGILGKWSLLDGSKRDYVFLKILKMRQVQPSPTSSSSVRTCKLRDFLPNKLLKAWCYLQRYFKRA